MSFKKKIGVIDLFCGIGGLSYGMYNKGLDIIAGFDIDQSCKYAFEKNNNSTFFCQDIESIDSKEIKKLLKGYKVKIIAGCAPCQPFSSYAYKVKDKDEGKYSLLYSFSRIVQEVLPDIVTMENVQQILTFEKPVLKDFIDVLEKCGYHVDVKKVFCPDYGIPQSRKRLVLLASRLGEISLIPPTHTPETYITVRKAIGMLPPIEAGETCKDDPLHVSSDLGELNMRRIIATPYGGGWKDWPNELLLDCHKKKSGKTYGSVYGRMVWDEPSPTMTTLCTGLGNGRFGHPVQNRAISVREAALLQTFPIDYIFFSPDEKISTTKASRYIGNAVPPRLGEVIARSILNHLNEK